MITVDIKGTLLIFFIVLYETPTFEARFNFPELFVRGFLEWVATAAIPAADETMESMDVRASRRKSALKVSQLLRSETLRLCELGTKQTRLVLRAPLAFYTYALKDGRIRKLFCHLFLRTDLSSRYAQRRAVLAALTC